MRVSLEWLAEWVDLPPTDALVERLTLAGLEVDAVERTGPSLEGLCVGHVLERRPHPGADRLSVCRVDAGGGEPLAVVCGAPNVEPGQKVAFAPPGARLPDGTKIKRAKIRGEASAGMICSARELGLSEDHEGILVLAAEAAPGAPLAEVLPAGDTVLEIALTANRGDCASLLGVAREVRALFGGELRRPPCEAPEGERAVEEDVQVEVEDAEGCHRYAARVVRGLRNRPSPEWLRRRLEAVGLRPIDAVVDVTNLVLQELGQPLHAFDLDRFESGSVRVRAAAAGESLVTLDGEERKLEAGDLLICDGPRPVALAGVMGGRSTEVGEGTRNVLLESAHFHPSRVRRTARRLGLHTDASYRFERGVDREGVERALDRAARLLAELCGGEVSRGRAVAVGHPPDATGRVALDPGRVSRLLGTELDAARVRECLARVGVEAREGADGRLDCRIPSHRNDLAIPEDLVEEVARIHGYEHIAPTRQRGTLVGGAVPELWPLSQGARDALCAEGLLEVMSFPFLDPDDLDRLGLAPDDPRRAAVRLRNPIAEGEGSLRPTLVASLLRLARENRNRQLDRVRLFEVARTWRRGAEGELPEETPRVAALMVRGEEKQLWEPRDPPPLFFELKGVLERLARHLGVAVEVAAGELEPWLHPGAGACVRAGDHLLGSLGELHPAVADAFGLAAPTAVLELDLRALGAAPALSRVYQPVSRHPRVQRDLAVLVDRDRPAGEILEALRAQGGPHLVSAEVFDRYEGRGVPEGRVSLAFRLVFQRADRTLTDAEVAKAVDRLVRMLAHRFGGELR